jgi:tRNA1(Val) A37 N6-methylase TrmN6
MVVHRTVFKGVILKRALIGSKLEVDQDRGHAFNLDTVLLADFVKLPYRIKHVIEVGTGNGAIALYLSEKTKAKITAIEIQALRYEKAVKNIKLNHLENQIDVIHQDYLETKYLHVDAIVCNPPFFKVNETSLLNEDDSITIARHEIKLDLESLIKKVSEQLKFGGKFFMIHRPDRLSDIFEYTKTYQLEIKRLKFVHPYIDKTANHILIECVKQGGKELILEPPLILYQAPHVLTEQAKKILGGNLDVT